MRNDKTMFNSFAITGIGRSGTKFLATIMDNSPTWNVRHETDGDQFQVWNPPEAKYIKIVQKRFERNNYGEVSWWLMQLIGQLQLHRKGLIFRDPAECWISICNRRKSEYRANIYLYHMYPQYRKLAEMAGSGLYRIISFKRMTTDVGYLTDVLHYFGIDDVKITPEMIKTKIHVVKNYGYNSLEDLSRRGKEEVLLWRKIIQNWLD